MQKELSQFAISGIILGMIMAWELPLFFSEVGRLSTGGAIMGAHTLRILIGFSAACYLSWRFWSQWGRLGDSLNQRKPEVL